MDRKEEWNRAFEVYLRQLSAKKAVIWTGDINCLGSSKGISLLPPLLSHLLMIAGNRHSKLEDEPQQECWMY
jgi:exonuclease III